MSLVEVKFGASKILWGVSSPTYLGESIEGGKFSYKTDLAPQFQHSTGKTPHKIFVAARDILVSMNLVEDVLISLLCLLMFIVIGFRIGWVGLRLRRRRRQRLSWGRFCLRGFGGSLILLLFSLEGRFVCL